MILKTIDLLVLADASKALKQKDFVYYNGYIYGLDNINGYMIYTYILDKLENHLMDGMIFNARSLSAFMKTIGSESEFDINFDENGCCIINTLFEGIMEIRIDRRLCPMINSKTTQISGYVMTQENDITMDLQPLFSLRKTDGCFYYKPTIMNNRYFMTLFSGLLPLNKSDKVLLSITDLGNSFISKFTVVKKKFKVTVVLCYLKV